MTSGMRPERLPRRHQVTLLVLAALVLVALVTLSVLGLAGVL